MLPPNLAVDLAAFREAFSAELSAVLAGLRDDPEVFGFGIDLPEDLSNLGWFGVHVGREGDTGGADPGSLTWKDRRYSPLEWGGEMRADEWINSGDRLEAIGTRWADDFIDDESAEDTPVGAAFLEALYDLFLDVTAEKADAGEFGGISYRVLFFNDEEGPITRRSLDRLNDPAVAAAATQVLC